MLRFQYPQIGLAERSQRAPLALLAAALASSAGGLCFVACWAVSDVRVYIGWG